MRIVAIGLRGIPEVQGGIETHCRNLYPRLVERGCDVTVLTRRRYVDPALTEYKGVKLVALPSPAGKNTETLFHTAAAVVRARREKADIVHFHAIGPSFFVPLAKALGMKTVLTHHGPDYLRDKWGFWAKTFLRRAEKNGVLYADAVIAISRHIAADIERRFGKKIAFIPNGIDPAQESGDTALLRARGLDAGRYILAVGRITPEKGFHDLLGAFEALCGALSDWKLVIVGAAQREDSYAKVLAARARANRNVVMTGELAMDQVSQLYCHAGLFVLPSHYEGLPLVLLEAMSHGLCCVVSDTPAARELCIGPDFVFPPGDVAGLAQKLRTWCRASWTSERRAEQINRLGPLYNWDVIAEETLRVYRAAAGGRGCQNDG